MQKGVNYQQPGNTPNIFIEGQALGKLTGCEDDFHHREECFLILEVQFK